MKLLVLSDLHLEHTAFAVDQKILQRSDVVVLAGDIHAGSRGVVWARKVFGHKPVVYVAGNHEFYDGHWTETLTELRHAAREQGVHFLENEAAEIAGVRFLGCTLWTDFEFNGRQRKYAAMKSAERGMNDYRLIQTGPPSGAQRNVRRARLRAKHTLARHKESRAWLEQELAGGSPKQTVVVTHHAPHCLSISPRFAGSPLNPAYVSNLPDSLLMQARLWIHGHTHSSTFYLVRREGDHTAVTCNARGYLTSDGGYENSEFDPHLLLEC
jgi:predicted phosphodiesterase